MSLGPSLRARLAAVPVAAFFALFSAFMAVAPAYAITDVVFGVGVTAPSPGSTVNGVVGFAGHASQDAASGNFIVTWSGGTVGVPATHADGNLLDWTASWDSTSSPDGAYAVSFHAVRASDSMSATSSPVSFTVSNGAFTVGITAPSAGATLTGAAVAMAATTSAAADSLTFVLTPSGPGSTVTVPATGHNGGTSWTASWDSNAATNGGYALIARSFHGGTMTESDARSVSVLNASSGPALAVSLGSPTGGAVLSGTATFNATTNIAATALTFNVRNGAGALIATLPASSGSGTVWTAAWDSTGVTNGSYAVRAVASKDGVNAESTLVSFTVSNAVATPPEPLVVGLLLPANGATVSGAVPLSAHTSATPDTLVFIVTQSFGDHQATVIPASGSGSSWTATWDASAAANGAYAILARATKSGVDTSSPVATVTLANAAPTPPPAPAPSPAMTVAVTSPATGVTLTGTATFVATTSAAPGSLAFILRDALHPDIIASTVNATGSNGNMIWSATVNTATVANGSYALVARATKDGVVTPSAAVAVIVSNAAPSSTTPVGFAVTLPVADATLSGSVTLSATANQAIDGFTFTVTGTTAGAAPNVLTATGNATKTVWNAPWDTRSVPNGDYVLATVAVKSGAQTAGEPRHFKVSNSAVSVTITSPSNNAEVSGTTEILVAAQPSANAVSVKLTNTLNTAITSTRNAAFDAGRQVWVVAWNTVDFANGTYRIEAKATDAQAHDFLAAPVTLKVANASSTTTSTQFTVRVVAPLGGATVSGSVGLAAAVTGDAATVQFYMSPASGEIRRADAHFDATRRLWLASWPSAENPNGTYTVGAVATNSSNAKAESAKVTVTVANAAQAPAPAPAVFAVRLLEPAGGNVTGKVHFVAQTEGVAAGVRFFVKLKGGTVQRELAGASDAAHLLWAADWDTAPEIVGTYEGLAVAKNAAGTEAASAVVTMFIERLGTTAPAPTGTTTEPKPVMVVLRPAPDAVLHGPAGLVAASPTAAKVRFSVRAADGKEVFAHDAAKGDLGWSVLWDTSAVPDARYRVEAAAFSSAGDRIGAASVGVGVANAAVRPPSGPIEIVPTEAVKVAINEAPAGTAPISSEQLPKEAGDAAAALDAECAKNAIPAERCMAWLALRHQSSECRDAGIITKEECVAFLKHRHGGEMPECQGKSPAECGQEIARQTAGLLDVSTLHAMKDTVVPHIGEVLRVPPRVELAESEGTAPVPPEGVGKDSPAAMTDLMPFANHRYMAVRVHASPSFAADGGDVSHESMPAVLFVDTDGDRLPDDVEKRLGTDPGKADTDGDGFDDGTEVSKGYNPLGKGRLADSGRALAPVDVAIVSGAPIEQPKSAGKEREDLKVDEASTPEDSKTGGMVLKGRGRPGEVVTVFVYSYLPVVFTTTVQDDGTWQYDLGSELTDGQHEVYATVTDDSGKIESKSNPLSFFVAEAKAVGADEFYKPEEESPVASAKVQEPVRQLAGWYLLGGGVLIVAALLLSYMLFMRPKKTIAPPPPPK
ncbi:MAG TPA: Ig-like domain-containing protein [Candidatus Binatia bacterium]|jgi:hypothetical protein|nr:Ig-like domain-containing protein [Candidatus Binatia bacterium]